MIEPARPRRPRLCCPLCRGSGRKAELRTCAECRGLGTRWMLLGARRCRACDGHGGRSAGGESCPRCAGAGLVAAGKR